MEVGFPGAGEVRHSFRIVPTIKTRFTGGNVTRFDLVLGLDFLCGFLSVFDFAGGELRLYEYGREAMGPLTAAL